MYSEPDKLIAKLLNPSETHVRHESEFVSAPEPADYSRAQVMYHIALCEDAGYMVTELVRTPRDFPDYKIGRLTWAGNEEPDRLR